MTQSPPPPEPDATPAQAVAATPMPRPWYSHLGWWGALVALLVLVYLLWLLWFQWLAAQQKAEVESILREQRSRTALWQAEADRLRAALKDDPCLADEALRQSPVLPDLLPAMPLQSEDSPQGQAAEQNPAAQNPSLSDLPPNAPLTEDQTPLSPPATMADRMEQATVLVLSEGREGMRMGTGFFIAPGIILTNEHVVGSAPKKIWAINKATKGVIPATLVTASKAKGQDYAVLRVTPIAGLEPLVFAPAVQRTERVSAWGFPNAVTGDDPQFQALVRGQGNTSPEVVYTDGAVSVILNRQPPLVVHTATVSQGNSGGPLVNAQGQVVGINTYIRLDEESYRQSSLAIMSPDVMHFLQSKNIPFTVASAAPSGAGAGNGAGAGAAAPANPAKSGPAAAPAATGAKKD